MTGAGLLGYAALLAALGVVAAVARRLRVPPAPFVVVAGLAAGRLGLGLVDPASLRPLLGPVLAHLAFVLAALGLELGRGLLRLSPPEVLRRSGPPLALAAFALLAGAALLPLLLPDLEPERGFGRFLLPLAFVFAAFPLLAVRDLRGHPPADVGGVFLVAIGLVGAVVSFTPTLLWSPELDPGIVWKGPVLVLGESGAFGVAAATLGLFATRRARVPARLAGTALFVVLVALSFRYDLWAPFAGLGFGIVLGRAGERSLPLPFAERGALFSELPFLALAALAFAPDLWLESLVLPSLAHAAYLVLLFLLVRARVPGGRRLATGPGILFLGLAVAIRLDGRMGPLMRVTVDFALPAWIVLRAVHAAAGRREPSG